MNALIAPFHEAAGHAGGVENPPLAEQYQRYAAARDFHWNLPAAESRRLHAQFRERYQELSGMILAQFTNPGGHSPDNQPVRSS